MKKSTSCRVNIGLLCGCVAAIVKEMTEAHNDAAYKKAEKKLYSRFVLLACQRYGQDHDLLCRQVAESVAEKRKQKPTPVLNYDIVTD